MKHLLIFIISLNLIVSPIAFGNQRIKDIASLAGVRTNQLIGYGLIVGLDGTGDQTGQTEFTVQSFRSMLKQFGISVPDGVSIQPKNIAAVALSAEIPAFAKKGQTIDVTVSSIGNSKSLRGGALLLAPLKGADGRIYAMAQGSIVVGGFGAEGSDGSSITVNVPSVGRIPNGATIEREVPSPFNNTKDLVFNLHRSDFTTAKRMADAINKMIGKGVAEPIDATSIKVKAPKGKSQRVNYVAVLENIQVKQGEASARIVVNSRTGTIVIGKHVVVSPAVVAHGNLSVTITEDPFVSQPNAFASGTTEVVQRSNVAAEEENNRAFLFPTSTSLEDIVRAVNEVGAAPSDLMAILEALKEAGALQANLIAI